MLSEDVKKRILVVADNNDGRISLQELAIIAMIHGMDAEDIPLFKPFCDVNDIVVYNKETELKEK